MKYTNLKPHNYVPRLIDQVVARKLSIFSALEISGTRWCGKSWTAAAFSNSITRVDENFDVYEADPSFALFGDNPHTIDEWQDIPTIWNSVRHAVDDAGGAKGLYVLTGSATPPDDNSRHSGAGRISRARMKTMTLTEMGMTPSRDKCVSLSGLFEGNFQPTPSNSNLETYARIICHGGWPALLDASLSIAQEYIQEYLETLFTVSMKKNGKSAHLSRKIALSLARNLGTNATLKTIAKDAAAGDSPASDATIKSYLTAFMSNYFIDELPGWDAPIKSQSRLRTKPKRYFDDPSLAAALLSLNPERLVENGQLFGLLFENLCHHELFVYAQMLPDIGFEPLAYYSDAEGLEVDFIIELRDGRWAAIEVKLGDNKIEEAASNLKRLKEKVLRNPAAQNKDPVFMAVILANTPFARQRKEDGIYVIPLDVLAP